MTDVDTITITKKEYDEFLRDSRFLECLEEGGVDNWEWYGDACDLFHERFPEYK